MDEAARYIDLPGFGLRLLGIVIMAAVRLLMAWPYRLRVAGRENLPPDGPFVLAPNHCSYLDPPVVAAALPPSVRRRTCWAGWAGKTHKGPIRRTASRSLRVYPVNADQDLGAAIRLGAQVLEAGDVLVWFPEGRRSRDGELQPFRPGIGVLLERSCAPVVPVCIHGTFAAWPPHRRWPRFTRLAVTFGPARSPDWLREHGEGEPDSARLGDGLRQAVAALCAADTTDGCTRRRA